MPAHLQPFQIRVIDEKAALDEKIGKLDMWIHSAAFDGLKKDEMIRLVQQLAAMNAYSSILGERIANFFK